MLRETNRSNAINLRIDLEASNAKVHGYNSWIDENGGKVQHSPKYRNGRRCLETFSRTCSYSTSTPLLEIAPPINPAVSYRRNLHEAARRWPISRAYNNDGRQQQRHTSPSYNNTQPVADSHSHTLLYPRNPLYRTNANNMLVWFPRIYAIGWATRDLTENICSSYTQDIFLFNKYRVSYELRKHVSIHMHTIVHSRAFTALLAVPQLPTTHVYLAGIRIRRSCRNVHTRTQDEWKFGMGFEA